MDIDELSENFELLDDWEDKYRYLIDLGEKLPHFAGDSDAAIVRGLIAVVLTVFDGKTREEILSLDVAAVFARLGLADHLSPSRRNGLGAMVEKIRFYASEG